MLTKIIYAIIEIIKIFFNKNKKTDTQKRLDEDKELANAIKHGDSETIARIRDKRKNYSNL